MATMKDVALKAGVSLSTVSYVISGRRTISAETTERIHKAMAELGFMPNSHARALASKRSRMIALVFAPSDRGLGVTEMDFVSSATRTAMGAGYNLVLWTAPTEHTDALGNIGKQGLADGILLMEVRVEDDRVRMLMESGTPFGIIGRCDNPPDVPFVDIDFDRTISDALEHLAALGHREIVFVNQSKEEFLRGYGPARRTVEAFDKHCTRLGLSGRREFCAAFASDGHRVCREILQVRPETTALIVMNDLAVPGILRAAQDLGRTIPRDLSVLSIVTSVRAAEMSIPRLTIMEMPSVKLAEIAITYLIGEIEGKSTDREGLLLPCPLVEGASTGPVRPAKT